MSTSFTNSPSICPSCHHPLASHDTWETEVLRVTGNDSVVEFVGYCCRYRGDFMCLCVMRPYVIKEHP